MMHLDAVLRSEPVAVHVDAPSIYNPIHLDDVVGTLRPLLEAASVPATSGPVMESILLTSGLTLWIV